MTNGFIATTPTQISIVRLAALKGMIRMEQAGMKTRGGALRPRIAAELGLKPRDSYEKFTAKIVEMMNAEHARLTEQAAAQAA